METTTTTSAASEIMFKDLCYLCDKISTSPRDKRTDYLYKFIKSFRDFAKKKKQENPSTDDSFFPILRLLLPHLDRERGAYGVKEHNLAKMYIRILGLPKEGQDALKLLNFRAPKTAGNLAGDFGEVAYYVLKNRSPEGGCLSVKQVNDHLDNIALKHAEHDPRGVDAELIALFTKMSASEQKWLIRMLLKSMKLGLGQGRIFYAYHPDARELYDVSNNLQKICETLRDPTVRLHEVEVSVFSPFRPMLAETCDVKIVEESMKKSSFYYVETKYDGERFQLHMKDGGFKYFSRNGFEYTDSYATILTPHISKLLHPSVKSCILDGEMMGWNKNLKCFKYKGGSNFEVKSLKQTDAIRPCFCVFDVLLHNNQVLTNKPLIERLKVLEKMFTSSEGVLMHTENKEVTTREEVIAELNLAIDNRLEGIVLKDPNSVYKPNTRKGGWYKIKPEYTDGLMDHVDLLIMGGFYGGGRRRGISHFLVGAAVPPRTEGAEPEEFHSVARVGSGYTMDELADLLVKLSPHWEKVNPDRCPPGLVWTKEKPDIWIPPQKSYILEIKATEMTPSNAYKVAYTLRFPRVETIRYDKKWSDCMTLSELENLRKEASGKLYSRHVDANETVNKSPRKKPKLTSAKPTVGEQFRGADVSSITAVSHLFAQKEFCVLTEWKDMSKQDIEIKIAEHGGSVVQNPDVNTFCALAGKPTLRVHNIEKSGRCCIARMEWLFRCIDARRLLPWSPADLLFATVEVEHKLAQEYDEFGDSYTQPATLESLKYSLEQVAKKGCAVELTEEMIADLEIELFSGPSPFSMFRLCKVYIDKFSRLNDSSSGTNRFLDFVELDVEFYSGLVCSQIEESTTHVVLFSGALERLEEIKALNREREKKFYIVSEQWVQDTVKQRRRQNECNYFL